MARTRCGRGRCNTMSDELLVRREDATLVLTLNRPERHHALNLALAQAVAAELEAAATDDDVRVVIITGAGDKAFCAGQDMLEQAGIEPAADSGRTTSAYLAIEAVQRCPLPVIAAINGYCFGGGAALAIACDLRLATPSATFRLPGAAYGLVVGAATFPRLVGSAMAKELIFTARRFGAAEALEWGMLNRVVAPAGLMADSLALAAEIAANSASAVRESKRVIDAATLDPRVVELENGINAGLRGSAEQTERFRRATRDVTGR